MPTYLNTANHPVDLGTGAFCAPQATAKLAQPNDTIDEHLKAGKLVELPTASKPRTSKPEEAS